MDAKVPHIKLYPSSQDVPRHQVESFSFLSFVSPGNLQIELLFVCLLAYLFCKTGWCGCTEAVSFPFSCISPGTRLLHSGKAAWLETCLHLSLLRRNKPQTHSISIASAGKKGEWVVLATFPVLLRVRGEGRGLALHALTASPQDMFL